MIAALALTPHQVVTIDAVLRLLETEPIVALRGLAGTGKSTLIPHLVERRPGATVAAATNKAAAVLRAKGIADVRAIFQCLKRRFEHGTGKETDATPAGFRAGVHHLSERDAGREGSRLQRKDCQVARPKIADKC
jgi:hypothetical protein